MSAEESPEKGVRGYKPILPSLPDAKTVADGDSEAPSVIGDSCLSGNVGECSVMVQSPTYELSHMEPVPYVTWMRLQR